MAHDQKAVYGQVDDFQQGGVVGPNGSEELHDRGKLFSGDEDPEIEKKTNDRGDVDGVEMFLDLTLRVFSHPVIDAAESLLDDLLVGVLNDFFPYKKLSAAVDVAETFVGSIDHKT